jgi:aryl-alcohol dehydrogenase-like predicted oxidoreductase
VPDTRRVSTWLNGAIDTQYRTMEGRLTAGGPLQLIAGDLGATRAQLAPARLLQRSPVLLPIPGTSTAAHLEANVAAALIELTGDQINELDAAV